MSQTQSDPTQLQSAPPAQAAGAAADDDPLAHLHKMSTTAGLGSGDYVAVNGAAVATLLLGLASGLAMLEEILLILPITAVVVGVIAWRQINQSNGTQTGKGLVAIGMLAALIFGGLVVAREATAGIRTRDDRAAIRAAIMEFSDKFKAGDAAGAYAMFSDNFRNAIDTTAFNERVNSVRGHEVLGAYKDAEWNGLAEFSNDPTGQRGAYTKFKMVFENTSVDVETQLRKGADGRWVFEGMPTFFPPPSQQQPRQ